MYILFHDIRLPRYHKKSVIVPSAGIRSIIVNGNDDDNSNK